MDIQKKSLWMGIALIALCGVMVLPQPSVPAGDEPMPSMATLTPEPMVTMVPVKSTSPGASSYRLKLVAPKEADPGEDPDLVPTPAPSAIAVFVPVETPEPTVVPTPTPAPTPTPTRAVMPKGTMDITVNLYNHVTGLVTKMNLEEYLIGVVAAEMGGTAEMSAIEAQAIAARTYAFTKIREFGGSGVSGVPSADISSDYRVGQAWISEKTMKSKFGQDYELTLARIKKAIANTKGVIVTYENEPILAMYFAASGGMTENAKTVIGKAYDYLVSVPSPNEEGYEGYRMVRRVTVEYFLKLISGKGVESGLEAEKLAGGVAIQSRTDTGRVEKVRVGTAMVTGQNIRSWFGLRSTNFTISVSSGEVVFTAYGFGHGVGMSQAGAMAMADRGATAQAILAHYYPGTKLTSIDKLV